MGDGIGNTNDSEHGNHNEGANEMTTQWKWELGKNKESNQMQKKNVLRRNFNTSNGNADANGNKTRGSQ